MNFGLLDAEIQSVKNYITKVDYMLEWGSGDSTDIFSPMVHRYYSIEHDPAWIKQRGQNVVQILTREENYCETASFIGLKFDKVLIDGIKRVECAKYLIEKSLIRSRSIVFVHDWEREEYHTILEDYRLVEKIDGIKEGTHKGLAVLKVK